MKHISRRQFIKFGAAASAATAISGALPLKSAAKELFDGNEDVAQKGVDLSLAGPKLTAKPGTCLQCGNTDGLVGFVDGKRLVKMEGNIKHPNTRGRLCAKGQAGPLQVYDPFRIKWPMMRKGERGDPNAKWERISMDEAIDEVAKRLKNIRNSGDPGRYVFHQGRNRFPLFTKRFNAAMGTEHTFEHTSICESSLKTGYYNSFGRDIDTSNAALGTKIILEFGCNIYEAGYMHHHMPQRITEARVNSGCRYIAFDPRMSNTAGRADEWYPINAGTDAAVMLAMANVIMKEDLANEDFLDQWTTYPANKLKTYLAPFTPAWAEKISGVPAENIRKLAIEFGEAAPKCYARAYKGICNHINGTYNARCVAMLNAVVGNIDEEGGFDLPKFTGFGKVDPEPHVDEVLKEIGAENAKFPLEEIEKEKFPLAKWGAAHLLPTWIKELDYKVGLYLMHQYNPTFSNPDQELWQEVLSDKDHVEFILDFSPYWSETAKMVSDLIIPDVTYMERLMVNEMPSVEQIPFIQLWQPMIDPVFSQSMYDTLLEVAKRIGGGMEKYFAFDTVEDFIKQAVEEKWGEGSYARLKKDGVLIGKKYDPKTYKNFAELTEAEKQKMREFTVYKEPMSPEDLAKLESEGAKIPTSESKQGEANFTSAPIKDKDDKDTLGVIRDGVAYKGFRTPTGIFEILSPKFMEYGFEGMPLYKPVKALEDLAEEQLVMITGKMNVHTQSRTQNLWSLMEISGYNPVWINPKVAERYDLNEEDEVIIIFEEGAKEMPCRVHITEGINPKCIFVSAHLGHWEYAPLANKGLNPTTNKPLWSTGVTMPGTPFEEGFSGDTQSNFNPTFLPTKETVPSPPRTFADDDVQPKLLPVTKDYKGRTSVGWIINAMLTVNDSITDPIGGEFAWCDTPVRIKKA